MALTAADVRRERLQALGREPFIEQLAEWLQHWSDALSAPESPKALQAWMLKHPDRAAQAQAIFGRLAGYTEKLEVRTDRYAALDALSDAELEQEVSRRFGLSSEALRGLVAKPVLAVSAERVEVTPEGEWASGGPAT
jgi:hypothetical protein